METLLSAMLLRQDDPVRISSNYVLTQRFYQRLLGQLERDPENFLRTIDELWSRIATPNNTKVYLAADANLLVKMIIKRATE